MKPVTREQALNSLGALEQMRRIYKSSGADGDTLRVAMGTVERFIIESSKKTNPLNPLESLNLPKPEGT